MSKLYDTIMRPSPAIAAYVGCASLATGMFLFGIGNALIKLCSADLRTIEVLFIRSFIGTAVLALIVLRRGDMSLFRTVRPKLQIARGSFGFLGTYLLFLSFALLPLADATALTFAITLFITALSYPMLRERVGLRRWLAVIVGFMGVMLIVRPTGQGSIAGGIVGVSSALIEGVGMIWARILSRSDRSLTTVFYHTGIIALLAGIFSVPWFAEGLRAYSAAGLPGGEVLKTVPDIVRPLWVTPTSTQWLALAVLGVVSALGHVCIVHAHSLAPAVVVSPMFYTLIIWGGLFGYLFWGEVPDVAFWIGAPVVILSNLYIVLREGRSGDNAPPEPSDA